MLRNSARDTLPFVETLFWESFLESDRARLKDPWDVRWAYELRRDIVLVADLREKSEPDEYKDLTESGDLIRTEEDDACDGKWSEEDEVPPTLLWYLWCVFREEVRRICSALSL